MSKYIQAKIEKFNKDIQGLKPSKAAARARNEVKELLKTYTLTSTRTYLTRYRKALKSDSSLVLNSLRLKKSDQAKIEKDYKKDISKAQKSLIKIKDYKGMIQCAIDLLGSNKYKDIAAGLCLLTGRRPTEILKTAKFTNSKNSKKVMYFKGQLKTKRINLKYEIYTLGNSKNECKKALKTLRSMLDTTKLSNEGAKKKYNQVLNDNINAHFSSYLGRCSAYDLRKSYSTICIKEYKAQSQATNSFLSQILGHEVDDVTTANSYQKYYIE